MKQNLKQKTHKRFSFPYPQNIENPDLFYNCMKNAAQAYRDEISDIYFSDPFNFTDSEGTAHRYGDVMSAWSDSRHIDNLYKIQDELDITISLTFNETFPSPYLIERMEVFDAFLNHLQSHYDRGLRMCTISNTHMMITGELQRRFPHMHWKNTVNHQVMTPQSVLDYHMMGYDTVLIDRFMNRDLKGLKQIRKLQKKYPKITTSLLVTEACMPSCPFKVEHDGMQAMPDYSYWGNQGKMTCSVWREEDNELPRVGTDVVWGDNETFDLYADNIDIFKFSGRMGTLNLENDSKVDDYKFVWINLDNIQGRRFAFDPTNLDGFDSTFFGACDSMEQIIEQGFGSINQWNETRMVPKDFDVTTTWEGQHERSKTSLWASKEGKRLNKLLMSCKNQCWNCHECEKVYNVPEYDSLIQVKRNIDDLQFIEIS